MQLLKFGSKEEMGREVAADAARLLRYILRKRGEANIALAADVSQVSVLTALARIKAVDWSRVTVFRLDDYFGLPATHPASFQRFFQKQFVTRLRQPARELHYVDAGGDPRTECRRLGAIVAEHPIDLAFVGIGEDGRLALNEPPADFQTDEPYLVVELSEAYRHQQLEEGWFETLEEVPSRAITMSIRQIMGSAEIICSVPNGRQAEAVRATIEGPVTPDVPASILQQHKAVTMYLDNDSAALLS